MALELYRRDILKKNAGEYEEEIDKMMKHIVTRKYPLDPLEILGERDFGEAEDVAPEQVGTPVQEFYRGQTILLTGGTGFMGKVVLEKLLRACPHIRHIYLLIRVKKGKTSHERVDEIFQDRLFCRLKQQVPKYYHKVSVIDGNLELSDLGICSEDRKKISEEVNIIFHGAATVRFDEKLRVAVAINLQGTREMINLAKGVRNLKAFMYVSTAFSHCPRSVVEEKFYENPNDYAEIIKAMQFIKDDDILNQITPSIIKEWPNTYTFTKALAEDMIRREAKGLPYGILRPTIIISTYKEPVRGWIDNVYGPIGVIIGICTGVIHIYSLRTDITTDMVPIDMVVNCLICAAPEIAKKSEQDDENSRIYAYSSSVQNPITWSRILETGPKNGHQWPTIRAVWYYSFIVITNEYASAFLYLFVHTMPGYIIDFIAIMTGRKPILTKIYKKINSMRQVLNYFQNREWTFKNDHTQALWSSLSAQDKELFFFDIKSMSWDYYLEAMFLGLRVYLVNDDIHTLPAARKKWRKLYFAHQILKLFVFSTLFFMVWALVKLFA